MNNDMRQQGCKGMGCPEADNCQRFLDRENRQFTFVSAPFTNYNEGAAQEFRCGYQEKPKKEDQ